MIGARICNGRVVNSVSILARLETVGSSLGKPRHLSAGSILRRRAGLALIASYALLNGARFANTWYEEVSSMKLREIPSLFKEAGMEWFNDNVPRLGAALAYYTIFALARS
jgi:hypothetical protein